MPTKKQQPPKVMTLTLTIMRLTGVGIIASGAATAVFPTMRTLMIPTFAVCATIFGLTLLSTLSKPKVTLKKNKAPPKEITPEPEPEVLLNSFEDDDSHLILISSPYFVNPAKITPNKGVTPDSIVVCEASAKGLPEQGIPSIQYSWRNASTGAFLGTRSKLDLGSTLVRPGQSIECLVTAEDDCGDMATSFAKILIEANLKKAETPTERFNRTELQARRAAFKRREGNSNLKRRSTDKRTTAARRSLEKNRLSAKEQTADELESSPRRRPLRQVYEGDDSSSIFSPMGMWD